MLSSIVVVSKNNVIGCENDLVFNIPEDLKRFKEITSSGSGIMIMGRKTFESLPGVLSNRTHIIITNNKEYSVTGSKEKVEIATDIDELIKKYENSADEVFIIGGGQIFEKLMPYTKKHYITYVDKDAVGDTFYPKMDLTQFQIEYQSDDIFSETENCTYKYVNYIKK